MIFCCKLDFFHKVNPVVKPSKRKRNEDFILAKNTGKHITFFTEKIRVIIFQQMFPQDKIGCTTKINKRSSVAKFSFYSLYHSIRQHY
jgi:hypothetical protein